MSPSVFPREIKYGVDARGSRDWTIWIYLGLHYSNELYTASVKLENIL